MFELKPLSVIEGEVISLEARLKSRFSKSLFENMGLDIALRIAQYFQKKQEDKRSLFDHDVHAQTIYPSIDAFIDEIHRHTHVGKDKIKKAVEFEDQGPWDRHEVELKRMNDVYEKRASRRSRLSGSIEGYSDERPRLPYLFDILVGIDDVHQYGVSFKYDDLSAEMFGLTTIRNNIFSENYGDFIELCSEALGVDQDMLARVIQRTRVTVSLTRRNAQPSEAKAEFIRNVKNQSGFAIVNYRVDVAGEYDGDTQPTVVSGEVLRLDWDLVPIVFESKKQVKNKESSLYHYLRLKGK
jgi:hypothetical protein